LTWGGLAATPPPATAVQGMVAGRVPGLATADANGVRKYTRPEAKVRFGPFPNPGTLFTAPL